MLVRARARCSGRPACGWPGAAGAGQGRAGRQNSNATHPLSTLVAARSRSSGRPVGITGLAHAPGHAPSPPLDRALSTSIALLGRRGPSAALRPTHSPARALVFFVPGPPAPRRFASSPCCLSSLLGRNPLSRCPSNPATQLLCCSAQLSSPPSFLQATLESRPRPLTIDPRTAQPAARCSPAQRCFGRPQHSPARSAPARSCPSD